MTKKFTQQDIDDMTEGLKKRPEHKWKKSLCLTPEEKLINKIVDNRGEVDIKALAKKYNKTSNDILKIINNLGLY